ncbi:MAG: acyltransferase family protein [Henriciella sp.]
MTSKSQRRYDLDWLRIIAFGILIFYHIGMFYVSWGWHVKSVHAGPAIEPLMKLVNPWRMSLLFLISGIALRYAMDKTPWGSFVWTRFWRLFLPLVFAMFTVIVPQAWLELRGTGEFSGSFWAFYPVYLQGSFGEFSITLPTWNHLWYIVYLLVYTLLLAALYPVIKWVTATTVTNRAGVLKFTLGWSAFVGVPVLLFGLNEHWLGEMFPSTHAFVGDWGNHLLYFPLLLFAFVFAKSATFWRLVSRSFIPVSVLTALFIGWKIFVWTLLDTELETVPYIELWISLHLFIEAAYPWVCILFVLGAGQRWLNRPSPALSYMTEAIFPWYILHQTLIVVAGVWLTGLALPVGVEFGLLSLATIGGCLVLHEFLIKRIAILRPLFGLKSAGNMGQTQSEPQAIT